MTHLIYLHQGHMALPSYLTNLAVTLSSILDGESYIAQANPWRVNTIRGIQNAAERAFDELKTLLISQPEITELSLVGVSLGGCILEKVAELLVQRERLPKLKYFITFASPLNGITIGWNIPTLAASVLGWLSTSLRDLVKSHDAHRESVRGVAAFQHRICLANLYNDWRVPLTSSLPISKEEIESITWETGKRQNITSNALDKTSCTWEVIPLDLRDRWSVHHAIVNDPRAIRAIAESLTAFEAFNTVS